MASAMLVLPVPTRPTHAYFADSRKPAQWRARMGLNFRAQFFTAGAGCLRSKRHKVHRLELEITEVVMLQGSDKTLDIMRHLHDLKIGISLDDFGKGYSSLSYLQKFCVDKIKIDRCFLANASDRGGLAVIRAISGLGRALQLVVMAQGVETWEQLELVRAEGCTEVQGYYFSPPVPADDIRRILLNSFAMPTLDASAAA